VENFGLADLRGAHPQQAVYADAGFPDRRRTPRQRPQTTGWAKALLVAPPQMFKIFSSRLISASGGAWALGSPTGV
jgi:hypothetical protein